MERKQVHIVVAGAGYAGLLAAVRLAGKLRNQAVALTLVNDSDRFVERLRLHQYAANRPITQRAIADILEGTGIEFVRGRVVGIEPAARTIVVEAAHETQRVGFDKLIYALGSTIEQDRVPGVREHAYTLTPAGPRSADALRSALPVLNQEHGRLVICGAGATGIEATAEFADGYPDVQVELYTRGAFASYWNGPVSSYMRRSLEERRVVIHEHTTVTALRANALVTASGETIPFDVCLWSGGFAVPRLAREAGLAVNARGQVLIDPFMHSISHPDIYAIGDAASPVEMPGVPVRMAAVTAAFMGAHSADCIAAELQGKTPQPFSFVYPGQGIALGKRNAIGFNNYPDDKPNPPYFTGRVGYETRELFVRLLAALPLIEKRWPGALFWPGKGRYAALKRKAAPRGRGDRIHEG